MSLNTNFNVPVAKPPKIPRNPLFDNARINRLRTDNIIGNYSSWKEPVRVITDGSDITLSGLQTVNGVSLVSGNRILVKDQTIGTENGIYTVRTIDWTRTEDLLSGVSAAGIVVISNEGSIGSDTAFVCTNEEGSAIVDVDSLTFSALSGGSGSPGGSSTNVQFNSSGLFAGSDNFTWDGSSIGLSRTGTTAVVSLQASTATGNYILTFPVDDGTSGQFLSTDGSGILSWAAASGGTGTSNPGGPLNSIQFNNPLGTFAGSSKLTFGTTSPVGGLPSSSGVITIGEATTNQLTAAVGIVTPSGTVANQYGTAFLLQSGRGGFNRGGGAMFFASGDGGANSTTNNVSGDGGSVQISCGDGGSGGHSAGGGFGITTGSAGGASSSVASLTGGGDINISMGDAINSVTGSRGAGGSFILTCGTGSSPTVQTFGVEDHGGKIEMTAGDGGGNLSYGGSVSFISGSADSLGGGLSTPADGGYMSLTTGNGPTQGFYPFQTGSAGYISLLTGQSSVGPSGYISISTGQYSTDTVLGTNANPNGTGSISMATGSINTGATTTSLSPIPAGSITFTAGDSNFGNGGSFNFNAGNSTGLSGQTQTGNGGGFVFTTGSVDLARKGDGGSFVVTCGNGGTLGGNGGSIDLTAGTDNNATGVAGNISLTAGIGTLNDGGNVSIFGGSSTLNNSGNVILKGGTGSSNGAVLICTSNTDNLGFFGATATTQVTTGITGSTGIQNTGSITVNENTTFDGYTIGQVVATLRLYGLLN